MADPAGGVFWYNQRWYDYTGTTLEEMRGRLRNTQIQCDNLAGVTKKLRSCWTAGERWEDTCPLKGKDGSYRWFLSRALPIRDAAGNLAFFFESYADHRDLHSFPTRRSSD